MTISENENFLNVIQYKNLKIEDVLTSCKTEHLSFERIERFKLALRLNNNKVGKQSEIDKVFLVDKGHRDGKELHCITKNGIIFILNERKFLNGYNALITALIARENQVVRLYEDCGLHVPETIIKKCRYHVSQGYNKK